MTASKTIYTLVLISLVLVLLLELWRLWFDERIYVGSFVKNTESGNEETNIEFGRSIVHWHNELRHLFASAPKGEFEAEADLIPDVSTPINNPESALSEVTITVQSVNITDILARLRRYVSTPREISGTLVEADGGLRATLDIDDGITRLSTGQTIGRHVQLLGSRSEERLAFDVACTLIWRQASERQKEIAEIDLRKFCNWSQAWVQFRKLRDRSFLLGGLSSEETEELRELRGHISLELKNDEPYLRFFSLRTNVNQLLLKYETESDVRIELNKEIMRDRLDYIVQLDVDPANNRREGERQMQAYAGMRPAIPVVDGKLDFTHIEEIDKAFKSSSFAQIWRQILAEPASNVIDKTSRATGFVSIVRNNQSSKKRSFKAIGIAVGSNLVLALVIDRHGPDFRGARVQKLSENNWTGTFSFAETFGEVEDAPIHTINRFVVLSEEGFGKLLLFEIEDHDVDANPVMELDPDALAESKDGNYIAVIGYPEFDTSLPAELMRAALGEKGGIKRVMPGRLLSLSDPGSAVALYGSRLTFEAMTSGGTGGSPVVDLRSGKVIGLNYAGRYQGSGVKFGYAAPLEVLFTSPEIADLFRGKAATVTFEEVAETLDSLEQKIELAIAETNVANNTESSSDSHNVEPAKETTPEQYSDRSGYNAEFLGEKLSIPMPELSANQIEDAAQVIVDGQTLNYHLNYHNFSIAMNAKRRLAFFSAVNVDGATLQNSVRPRGPWKLDPRIESDHQASNALYARNRLDRGHLVRRGDPTWGNFVTAARAALDVYHYTNATPQHSILNQGSWFELEEFVLTHLQQTKQRGLVFSGPVFAPDDPLYRDFKIPQAFWKVLVTADSKQAKPRVAAFLLRQRLRIVNDEIEAAVDSFDPIDSRITLFDLEQLTGLRFRGLGDDLDSPF